MRVFIILLFMIVLSQALFAARTGDPKISRGGTFYSNIGSAPPSLNPLSSTDGYASEVQSYVMEELASRNIETFQWEPALAKSWIIAKNGMSFVFTLKEGIKWHDGKPLSVKDVKFSFDAIMHPKNKYRTAHLMPYYENIKEVKILDKRTVRFMVKKKYFNNFAVVASMTVVPQHIYENPTEAQRKKLSKTLVGTGPYVLKKYQRGRSIILNGNPHWWGLADKKNKIKHNFGKITIKFVKDETVSMQMLERKDIDFMGFTAEQYVKKAKGKHWGKDVFKFQVANKAPKGYSFIGWNLRNVLFQNKNVRKALYHLINRKLMIKKFEYDFSVPATGPQHVSSIYANPRVKAVEYNPQKALALLRKEGWKDSNKDRILDKIIDGRRVNFKFTILEPRKEFEKYLTIFKEDASKVGVDVNIKTIEWSSFLKLLHERKFEAVRLAWGGGGVDWDPKQIWHSHSAKSGSNFIGYKNPKVDRLIDQARIIMDRKKRVKILHKVYKMIADDHPYVFFFNRKYSFYGHTNRVKKKKDTYTYGIGTYYWWLQK